MRFVCGDVRGLIVSYKNDHGPSRRRYRALQRERRLICFCEIFGVVRFSTFATISANIGLDGLISPRFRHHQPDHGQTCRRNRGEPHERNTASETIGGIAGQQRA
jgi:hypothetical protein